MRAVLLTLALATAAISAAAEEWPPLHVLGKVVVPGQTLTLSLLASESFMGAALPTPVLVTRGARPGPSLCLTAGIHGDEVNGVEIVRQVIEETQPLELAGTLLSVPVVNLHGFRRGSRYLPDRRDLNRFFPGNPRGSSASRIAHGLFDGVIRHCDALVDLHTGSFHRTNLPQVRADLRDPKIADLAQAFGAEIVVHSIGQLGTLRRSASLVSIPAITYEAGEPTRFQREEVERGVAGVKSVMRSLGMVDEGGPWIRGRQRVYYRSRWVRVDDGGILRSRISLGDVVATGEVLGIVIDPLSSERAVVRAPQRGRVIGKAVDQVVIPGYAAFHIGIEPDASEGTVLASDDVEAGDRGTAAEEAVPVELDERPE